MTGRILIVGLKWGPRTSLLVLRHCKDFSCHGHPDRDKGLSLSDGPEEGFSGSALLSDKKRKQNTVPENGVSNSVEGTR